MALIKKRVLLEYRLGPYEYRKRATKFILEVGLSNTQFVDLAPGSIYGPWLYLALTQELGVEQPSALR